MVRAALSGELDGIAFEPPPGVRPAAARSLPGRAERGPDPRAHLARRGRLRPARRASWPSASRRTSSPSRRRSARTSGPRRSTLSSSVGAAGPSLARELLDQARWLCQPHLAPWARLGHEPSSLPFLAIPELAPPPRGGFLFRTPGRLVVRSPARPDARTPARLDARAIETWSSARRDRPTKPGAPAPALSCRGRRRRPAGRHGALGSASGAPSVKACQANQ